MTFSPDAPFRSDCLLRGGMVGAGMIFDETYRPFFEQAAEAGLFDRRFGVCRVELGAMATRTGRRVEAFVAESAQRGRPLQSFSGEQGVENLLQSGVDFVCVATPDDRHFSAAKSALLAGKHVLIEKPSVLTLQELDELSALAAEKGLLAKVVYHKLLDPDHKKLRTLVADGVLQSVNSGYCSLLEPKQISASQFAEWIVGRNPATYVACHYIKLIDFTFGGRLHSVSCSGQRGIVGPANGPTWDGVQLRLVYRYESGREAAFDIHTSWTTPDNFPGYVEQEVQFRFDNGVWNAHSRKRGVELTVEGRTPTELKTTINNHYNGSFLEPWEARSRRGYGLEVLERYVREVAYVEHGGPADQRGGRLSSMRELSYNDLSADRQTVAAVQALEAILARLAAGGRDSVVYVDEPRGGLVLHEVGSSEPTVLYAGRVNGPDRE